MKKRIGWLSARAPYIGGAELSMQAFRKAAPDDYEIVSCPVGRVAPDVDGYVVGNCAGYGADIIPLLTSKPTVKIVFDIWKDGDRRLREALLTYATRVILVSPVLKDWLNAPIAAPIENIPCPVDVARFRAAVNGQQRAGAVWAGRMWPGKGLESALAWADQAKLNLDCYGFGPGAATLGNHYKGDVEPEEMPGILAQYRTFVFLPDEPDPCPRTVIEAWAAGCELVLNGNVGSAWWIQHEPAALENATDKFWQMVEEVI